MWPWIFGSGLWLWEWCLSLLKSFIYIMVVSHSFPFFFLHIVFISQLLFIFFNHLLSYSHTVFCIWMQLLTLEFQGCWFESWLAFYLDNIVVKVFFGKIVLFDERRFTRKKIYLWLAKAGETSCADSLCGFPLDINKIPHYFSSKTIRVL